MELRQIGTSGLRVSLVGLGGNNFGGLLDVEKSRAVVHKALDVGITFIDTADIYGNPKGNSELVLGEILGPRRKDMVLATKCGKPMDPPANVKKGGSRRYIINAAEDSLKRLRTDHIDLFYMHDPDPLTPIEESLRALDDLVRAGKVRYIACSNFKAWQVADARWTAQVQRLNGFVGAQDEYSLLQRKAEAEMIPSLRAHGLGLVPYFPLANGLLTGKYKRDAMPKGSRLTDQAWFANYTLSEANWTRVEALASFCGTRGKKMTELAFSWLAAQPVVAGIIAGATKPEQVEQNAQAVNWKLTADELAELDKITA
jgi:aryl-alcohol dehydrogenase-like predicted oxidoreductase